MASLSAAQRKVVGEYLRELADKLGLRDWTVTVMHATPQEDGAEAGYLAQVSSDRGGWEAKLFFRPDFVDLSADAIRETCVHELLHVHRRSIVHLNVQALKDELSVGAWNVWMETYTLLDEAATEAVALAIAPLMPAFPGWGKA